MKINYRPEIDGLRAIAVGLVIIYHAQVYIFDSQIFTGGFIGVDIFFVISGYLITSIILKELLATDNFQFKNFYERRARRILPALLFIILFSLPFAWIYFYPIDLINFSKSILYSLGFSSNFFFHFSGLEYASPEGILKPFLHTWSLSVEEQYYVLFPILLVTIFRYFKKYLFLFLLLSFATSLILADWSSRNYPSSTFYLLHTRIWELIGGSLLAYFEINFSRKKINNFLSQFCPSLGLILIGYAAFFFDDKIFHPSFYTLVPVIGVALILWFANKNEVTTKLLSSKFLVGIGLISYSLYLWHYTIFSFAKNLDILFDDNFGKFILILLTIILSTFTYFLIEQPARKKISFKLFFSFLVISTSVIIILNATVIVKDGFLNRLKVKNYQNKHTFAYLTQEGGHCFGRTKNFCKFGSGKKQIILLGDSHFGSLAFDLKNRTELDYTFVPIVIPGYFHLRKSYLLNKHTKKINNEYNSLRDSIDVILKESKNNIIIIGGATSLYLYQKRVKDRALHWNSLFVDKKTLKYDTRSLEKDFSDLLDDLSKNNDVILLYPIPEIGTNLQKKKFENMVRVYNYYYSDFLNQNYEVLNFFDSINHQNVHKVYPHKVFCDINTDLCSTHDKDNFFFFDGYHPSLEGAKMINSLIMKKIEELRN